MIYRVSMLIPKTKTIGEGYINGDAHDVSLFSADHSIVDRLCFPEIMAFGADGIRLRGMESTGKFDKIRREIFKYQEWFCSYILSPECGYEGQDFRSRATGQNSPDVSTMRIATLRPRR